MNNKVYIEPSGIPLVDKKWGGFYIGGAYFLIGPSGSGKTILGIQCARECVRQKQVCLFFTSMKLKDLIILASTIDFDLEAFINQDLIIVIRITLPELSGDFTKHDDELSMHWNEIVNVIEEYNVDRIVFDDFTPFIGFNKLSSLKDVFSNSMETLEEKLMTSLFIFSEPANSITENLVNTVVKEGNGVIYINSEKQGNYGNMKITPILGHPEGQFKSGYKIKPYEGVVVDYSDLSMVQEVLKGKIRVEDSDEYGLECDGRRNVFNDEFTFGTERNNFNLDDTDDDTEE